MEEALSECLLLTRAQPCQGLQCLKPTGTGKATFWSVLTASSSLFQPQE